MNEKMRIGFVSTRIAGLDGVSLEISKWAEVLEGMGHTCFYLAGECDRPADRSLLIDLAHFKHPAIMEIHEACFGRELRTLEISRKIHEITWIIKKKLHQAFREMELDLIIAENCLTIPLNIPLGEALLEVLMESGVSCIAHHHDFYWERDRFSVNAVEDYLRAVFPPAIARIDHVVINNKAGREFSRRTGLSCHVIPNIMDFDHPPLPLDEYGREFRPALGIEPSEILVLQPTRVVPRKGIEHSIELVAELGTASCKLVVTHASGDEGDDYAKRLRRYAEHFQVPLIFADPIIQSKRAEGSAAQKLFTPWDAYQNCDLVAYPSTYEGFGNAFLEAIYFRKPIFCNRYVIYRTDIDPCGFKVCLMDGFLNDEVVEQVRRVLDNKEHREEMVEHNYQVGRRYFSYARLEGELRAMLAGPRLQSWSPIHAPSPAPLRRPSALSSLLHRVRERLRVKRRK